MAVAPALIERFGGLDTRGDFFEVGADAAAVARNVWLGDPARLRRRAAATQLYSTTQTGSAGYSIHDLGAGSTLLVSALDVRRNGTSLYAPLGVTDRHSVAVNSEGQALIAQADLLRFVSAAGVVSTIATYKPVLCAWWNDRPVMARLIDNAGAGRNFMSVRFGRPMSEVATPTFDADDYVDLGGGAGADGGPTAIAVYQDRLFIFEARRFHVFYGISTDAQGEPIFNYRTVDARVGPEQLEHVCVGRGGVYFIDDAGHVWRTTGGPPQRALEVLDGLADRKVIHNPVDDLGRDSRVLVAGHGYIALGYQVSLDYGRVLLCDEDGRGLVEWDLPWQYDSASKRIGGLCLRRQSGHVYLAYTSVVAASRSICQVKLGATGAAAGSSDVNGLAWSAEYVPGGRLPGEPAGVRTVRRALIRSVVAPYRARWYTDESRSGLLALRSLHGVAQQVGTGDSRPELNDRQGTYAVDQAARGRQIRLGVDPGQGAVTSIEVHIEAQRPPGEGFAALTEGVPS